MAENSSSSSERGEDEPLDVRSQVKEGLDTLVDLCGKDHRPEIRLAAAQALARLGREEADR